MQVVAPSTYNLDAQELSTSQYPQRLFRTVATDSQNLGFDRSIIGYIGFANQAAISLTRSFTAGKGVTMTRHNNTERRSSYSQCASYGPHDDEDNDSMALPFNSLIAHTAHSTLTGMPSFDRNKYSNKESAKVNQGLPFWFPIDDNETANNTNVAKALTSQAPALKIAFGRFTMPTMPPAASTLTEQLVRLLLSPPPHAFLHGVLSIQWVIGAVGRLQHFIFRSSDERFLLKEDSELRNRGANLGMPAPYMEWICGDDEGITAAEQGLCLTSEFFEELEENGKHR